jgi:hypothetical protein
MPALKHLAHLLASLAVTVSRNWNRPVAELLRERWPVNAQLMGVGILGG